jgi:hypothetical protein
MSESFRERIKQNERLLNQLTDYEENHELEWCPISDDMLKEMYPGQCDSQEDRDHKVDSMPQEEFEILFDATMQRYRKVKRKKKKQGEEGKSDQQEDEQVEQEKQQEEAAVVR